jgi:hypothetical protein
MLYRVVFYDDIGHTLYRCRVKTLGDKDKAVEIACEQRAEWYRLCSQLAVFPLAED